MKTRVRSFILLFINVKMKDLTPYFSRPLLRQIYNADIDLVPDVNSKTLTTKLHGLTNRQSDRAVNLLCNHLNETETIYPGTGYKLNFELVSIPDPRVQVF